MKKITALALATATVAVAATLTLTASPQAASASPAPSAAIASAPHETPLDGVSTAQLHATLDALRAAGRVAGDSIDAAGERTTTLDVGDGARVSIVEPGERQSRLSGGKDGNGFYVSFTNTDQAIILGGGAALMTAGLCAILAVPTAGIGCGVVTAIMVVVTAFVTSNGGSCPAGKSLRVWVTNTGAKNPKCV